MALFPVFGKNPAAERLQRVRQSPHYKVDHFENLVSTEITLKGVTMFKMLGEYRNRPADTTPAQPLPFVRTDLRALPTEKPWVVWFGHSSYLLQIDGRYILVDPVFSANASPVSFLAKAYPGTTAYSADDMPDIDILLLTHDHYDHLDYQSILRLASKTKHFCTSLGVGEHLEFWGIARDKITELDWWESWTAKAGNMGFTATPARHFSGRTFKRGATLWSSFVLKSGGYSLFLGGDSGYEQHFKLIGDRFGPFDLAILECGQYGKNWPYIHMLPEQTVAAALDLKAAALMPVHWGKFTLALHPWDEPVRRVVDAFAETSSTKGTTGLRLATPMIGQPVLVGGPYPDAHWWDFSLSRGNV
jgi:L-ascorbate metabolism protein UlaG (beta-lactamase superfamily)